MPYMTSRREHLALSRSPGNSLRLSLEFGLRFCPYETLFHRPYPRLFHDPESPPATSYDLTISHLPSSTMPPRANLRRPGARLSAPEPDHPGDISPLTPGVQAVLKVPLPALQGTSSARRQYSYGAAVQPLAPRRHIGGAQGDNAQTGDKDEPLNLQRALKYSIYRQQPPVNGGEKSAPAAPAAPVNSNKSPRKRQQRLDADADDELASAAFPPPQKTQAVPTTSSELDLDDTRSFGIESDFYGDATIGSLVDGDYQPSTEDVESRAQAPAASKSRASRGPKDPTYRDVPEESSSSEQSVADMLIAEPLDDSASKRRRSTKGPRDPTYRNRPDDEESSEDQGNGRRRGQSRRKRPTARPHPQLQDTAEPAKVLSGPAAIAPDTNQRPDARDAALTDGVLGNNEEAARAPPDQFVHSIVSAQAREARQRPRTKIIAREKEPSPVRNFPSDHSEQDSAFQEELRAREEQTANSHADVYASQKSRSDLSRTRRQSPQKSWALPSLPSHLRWTSIRAYINHTWRSLRRHLPSGFTLAYILGFLVFVVPLLLAALHHSPGRDELMNQASRIPTLFSDSSALLAHKWRTFLGGRVRPDVESLFDSPDAQREIKELLEDVLRTQDAQSYTIKEVTSSHEELLGQHHVLKKAGLVYQGEIAKFNKIIPKTVYMELDDKGRPIVASEFWYALRELISKDDDIFTLDEDRSITERQSKAVSSALLKDRTFLSHIEENVGEKLDPKISALWDSWSKQNAQNVHETPVGSGVVVTRDEFLTHLRNTITTHKSEIQADLKELKSSIRTMIHDRMEELDRKRGAAAENAGLNRAETLALVAQELSKALANAKMGALARSQVHAHFDDFLQNQVNFLSMGSGAVVNVKFSSVTYDPFQQGLQNNKALEQGIRSAKPYEHNEALKGWQDDGDKWCAAAGTNNEGQMHGYVLAILLGRPVVPQHVVVEHILPGATLDPDARPRDMEIWAEIEDPEVRTRVEDFSRTNLPKREASEPKASLPNSYVRIGQFTYSGAEVHNGVHVHRLSSELEKIGAETSNIVFRALNTYGSPDHACFYRVRMYGLHKEVQPTAKKAAKSSSGSWLRYWS